MVLEANRISAAVVLLPPQPQMRILIPCVAQAHVIIW